MSKQYDYRALLDDYVKIPPKGWVKEEVRQFYIERVNKLAQLMQVKFKDGAVGLLHLDDMYEDTLRMTFESAIRHINQPGILAGWIEGGPDIVLDHYMKDDKRADPVQTAFSQVLAAEAEAKRAYRVFLEALFVLFYPECTTKIFTSEDLLALGFDDSNEPEIIYDL